MGTFIRVTLGIVALLVVLAAWVWYSMRPPDPLAVPNRGATISGVTVINPGADRRAGQRVVIEGDAISSIEVDPSPEGAYVGAFVLPGLIDMHVHFPPFSGLGSGDAVPFLFLLHGVTTVRNAGDLDGTADPVVRSGVEGGRFPGPRVFSCGPFVDGPGSAWKNTRVLTDPDAAPALVAELARDYDCIKAYNNLSPDVAEALHRAARAAGVPVIGHVPTGERFVTAHLDDAQHMMGMAFTEGNENPFPQSLGAWATLDDSGIDEIVRAAIDQRKALTPTLVVIDRLSRGHEYAALASTPEARLMPRVYRDLVWDVDPELTPEHYAGMRIALAAEQRVIRRLFDGGATLHVGTDPLVFFVVPGAGLHRELRLFANAGIPIEDVWRLATAGNGAALPPENLGRLVPGAPADLLIFRRDPTRDLDALSSLEAVVAQGRLYTREALEGQRARYQSYYESFVFDTLSVFIARRVLGRIGRDPDDEASLEETGAR